MEKNKGIFDMALDSMLASTPIEVDSVNDGLYPVDLISSVQTDKDKADEAAAKQAIEEEQKGLIDLEDNETIEEESEEELEDGIKETPEEPSSNKEQSPQKGKSKTSSPLTPYAQLLVDEGVLPNLNVKDFDGTAESLKEAMVNEILTAVDTYKDSLPERVKSLINNYEEGVPLDKLIELDRIETDVAKVTNETLEEDSTLQKKLVSDYLKRTTKFSDAKIAKQVDNYEDTGELEDEAKAALEELKGIVKSEKEKSIQENEKQKLANEKQRKEDLVALENKVKTTDEIIPGLKLNDKVRKSVFSSMTTPVGYDQTGRPVNKIVAARMENPVDFEIKLHYLFEVTKGFTDFSKLAEKGKKDASKQFEEAVNEMGTQSFEGIETQKQLGKKSTDFLKSLGKVYNI
jgi:hypothetical protein